jgi:hypothetical protein
MSSIGRHTIFNTVGDIAHIGERRHPEAKTTLKRLRIDRLENSAIRIFRGSAFAHIEKAPEPL